MQFLASQGAQGEDGCNAASVPPPAPSDVSRDDCQLGSLLPSGAWGLVTDSLGPSAPWACERRCLGETEQTDSKERGSNSLFSSSALPVHAPVDVRRSVQYMSPGATRTDVPITWLSSVVLVAPTEAESHWGQQSWSARLLLEGRYGWEVSQFWGLIWERLGNVWGGVCALSKLLQKSYF